MEHSRRRLHHWFHVKPAPVPRNVCHAAHSSQAAHVDTIGFAELLQQTARDLPRPKQMYLPRSSAAAARRIPLGTTYLTGDRYRALGGGITLLPCATAYALPASEEGEGITSHQQLEITAFTIGDVCRVSRSIAVGRFTIGFT